MKKTLQKEELSVKVLANKDEKEHKKNEPSGEFHVEMKFNDEKMKKTLKNSKKSKKSS